MVVVSSIVKRGKGINEFAYEILLAVTLGK